MGEAKHVPNPIFASGGRLAPDDRAAPPCLYGWFQVKPSPAPFATGEKMASSRRNGKNAHTPASDAGSPEVGQDQAGEFLTTAQGLRLPDTDHSLKAGERGPTLLEDFHLREKITHFDHE